MLNSLRTHAALIALFGWMSVSAVANAQPSASASAQADLYVRYTPTRCDQAARLEIQRLHGKAADTLYHAPLGDTRAPATVAAVRACVARFSVATVAPDELLGLAGAYLAANQDADAKSAFGRLEMLNADKAPAVRAWVMYQIVQLYMAASPSRLAAAQEYAARIDTLGALAAPERLLAHNVIADAALALDSLALLETHATAAITASRALVGDSAIMYARPTMRAYFARAELHLRRGELPAMRSTMTEIATIMRRVRSTLVRNVEFQSVWYAMIGDTAPPVRATRWLNASSSAPTVPEAGKSTLLMFANSGCDLWWSDSRCYPQYVILRRLMAAHPTLAVTIVTRTDGFYRNRLVEPDSESTLVERYFKTIVRLPVPIALWGTTFDRRASDNYMQAQPNPNEKAYKIDGLKRSMSGGPLAVLVDASGIIRRVAPLTWDNLRMFDHTIAGMLAR